MDDGKKFLRENWDEKFQVGKWVKKTKKKNGRL